MRALITNLVLLAIASTASVVRAQEDANCTAVFEATALAMFLSDECEPTPTECPAGCGTLMETLHTACDGKNYTTEEEDGTTEEEAYMPATLAAFSFFMDGACADYPYQWLMSRDDVNTCNDWAPISMAAALLTCSDNCTDTCKAIIDKQYEVCSADDSVMIDGESTSIQELEMGAAFLRSDECQTYAEGLEFMGGGGGGGDDVPVPAPAPGEGDGGGAGDDVPAPAPAPTANEEVPTTDAGALDAPSVDTPSVDAPSVDPPSVDPPSVDSQDGTRGGISSTNGDGTAGAQSNTSSALSNSYFMGLVVVFVPLLVSVVM